MVRLPHGKYVQNYLKIISKQVIFQDFSKCNLLKRSVFLKSDFLKSIFEPINPSLEFVREDIAQAKEMSGEETLAFQKHCDRFTVSGIYSTYFALIAGTLIWWPWDLLAYNHHSLEMKAIFLIRIVLLIVSTLSILSIRRNLFISKAPLLFGVVVYSITAAIIGWIIGQAGGFNSAMSYSIYTAPLLTLFMYIKLYRRIFYTYIISFVFYFAIVLGQSGSLDLKTAALPFAWLACTAALVVISGHIFYLVFQTNFIQRRKLNDLTKNLQARVVEQTKKISQLTTAVFKVQEHERNRIAHDLHDELGQMLVRMDMEVQLLDKENETKESKANGFEQGIHSLHFMVSRFHDTLDRILGALKPILLDNQGFDVAVTAMVNDLAKGQGIKAKVLFEADVDFFSDTAKTALFRIVQEGTTNVIKHADADELIVRFSESNDMLELSITDNGRGFDPKKALAKNRLGLRGIEERVKLLGGEMTIKTKTGDGTEISICFSLEKMEQGDKK